MQDEARRMRLNRRYADAAREKNYPEIIKSRFALLGYSYSEDDSGGGSALDSILSASATLGSAYVASTAPVNSVTVPTRTIPAYGAAAPTSSSSILIIVVLLLVAGVAFFALKG